MQLPTEVLHKLERIPHPHFGYYRNSMNLKPEPGVVNFRNRKYHGLHEFLNVAEDRALNPPPHVRAAQAMAATVQDNPNIKFKFYVSDHASLAEKAASIFEDGLDYYNLKRLTRKQKDYVYGWIEDAIQAHTRSQHEQATVIIEVFSGQRSSLDNIHRGRSEPFKPTLGAFRNTHNHVSCTVKILQKLGAFQEYDAYALATAVMRKAGCDMDEFDKSMRMRNAMKYAKHVEKVVQWMKDVDETLHGHLPSEVDMNEVVACLDDKKATYPFNPLKKAVHHVNQYAAWLRLNQDVYKDDTELDFFVDEVMKRLVTRMKSRG